MRTVARVALTLVLVCSGAAMAGAEDSDGDGMPDTWENRHDLDPDRPNADGDPDRDDLSNILEYTEHGDPRDKDADDDGLGDRAELMRWYSRLDRKDHIVGRVVGKGACANAPCPTRPLFGIRVVLRDGSGSEVARTRTHTNGRFTFRAQPGNFELEAHSVDGFTAPEAASIHVSRRQTGPVRVFFHHASSTGSGVVGQATLSPTCGGPQRIGEECATPFEGATIHIEDDQGKELASSTTDADGFYSFPLDAGIYTLVCEGTGQNLPSPPEPAEFEVSLTDSGPHYINCPYDTGIR